MQKITRLPYKLGITGTMGAGKSLVGQCLTELGVPVLDTDEVVADLYRKNITLQKALIDYFGSEISLNGVIDKKLLAQRVFADAEALKFLEAQIHPLVGEAVNAFLTNQEGNSAIKAVLVPLLFEANTQDRYDEIWTVVVYPETELVKRLLQRGGVSVEDIEKRMKRQWSQQEKADRAQRLIDNSGSVENTQKQILTALQAIGDKFR